MVQQAWTLFAFCMVFVIASVSTRDILTKTRLGNILGIQSQRTLLSGRQVAVDIYLGVPFAEPPLGNLRFKRTRPRSGWTGTLKATKPPPVCIQLKPPPPPGQGNTRPNQPPIPPAAPQGTGNSQPFGGGSAPSGFDLSQLFGGNNAPPKPDMSASSLTSGGKAPPEGNIHRGDMPRGDTPQTFGGDNVPAGFDLAGLFGGDNNPQASQQESGISTLPGSRRKREAPIENSTGPRPGLNSTQISPSIGAKEEENVTKNFESGIQLEKTLGRPDLDKALTDSHSTLQSTAGDGEDYDFTTRVTSTRPLDPAQSFSGRPAPTTPEALTSGSSRTGVSRETDNPAGSGVTPPMMPDQTTTEEEEVEDAVKDLLWNWDTDWQEGLPMPSVNDGQNPPAFPKAPESIAPSFTVSESEDCLYLNIFIPEKEENTSLPVLIWIHGGGFAVGGSVDPAFDPASLAVNTGSIVVAISYRLNVFGFFALDDGDYPGNLGLWDQLEALKWVRNNIDSFGGDSERITIAGHSAGAKSVSLHVANPQTKGLFQQAISLSGIAMRFEQTKETVRLASEALLMNINCAPERKLTCLEKLSVPDIMSRLNYIYSMDFSFVPMFDNILFKKNPKDALLSGDFNQVPYLIGLNTDEGIGNAIKVLQEYGDGIRPEHLTSAVTEDIMNSVKKKYNLKISFIQELALVALIRGHYVLDEDQDTFDTLRKVIDIYSEFKYVEPSITFADLLSQKSENVYLHLFNHTLAFSKKDYEESLGIQVGAGHKEPLPILLAQDRVPLTQFEKRLSSEIAESLRDFLYNGNSIFNQTLAFWSTIMPAAISDLRAPCVLDEDQRSPAPEEPGVVRTTHGYLRGLMDTHLDTGLPYLAFLGVPYAEPPTGTRRWMPPEPVRWRQEREAFTFGPVCPQGGTADESENCLHLNIWLPFQLQNSETTEYPTIVYLHGGKFQTGSGNDPAMLDLAFKMNAIVVSVNFRLGALGFLSTGTTEHPGNNAHRDILMALGWISENINAFGGNADRVTLLGEDSGAALASQLMFSRRSKDLFQNVIAMGGSSSSPWAVDAHPQITAQNFAEALGCPTSNTNVLMKCIHGKDTAALLTPFSNRDANLGGESYKSPLASYPWRPTNDEYINWRKPRKVFPGWLVTGVTQYEGAHLFNDMNTSKSFKNGGFMNIIKSFLSEDVSASKAFFEDVKLTYNLTHVDETDEKALKSVAADIVNDWLYKAPQTADLEKMIGVSGLCYAYKFNYKSGKNSANLEGPAHGEDFRLLMEYVTSSNEDFSRLDQLTSEYLYKQLRGFVANGRPDDELEPSWSNYYTYGKSFLTVDSNGSVSSEVYPKDEGARLHLWNEMLATYSLLQKSACGDDHSHNSLANGPKGSVPRTTPVTESTNSWTNNGNSEIHMVTSLPSTADQAIINIGIFESQVIMLTLGGVCVVLFCVAVSLATAYCSMRRHLGTKNAPTQSSTSAPYFVQNVTLENDLLSQTKM